MQKNFSMPAELRCRERCMMRSLTLIFLAAILCSCAAIKFGYENAESIGILWIDRYFDLDRAQEEMVRVRIRKFMAWHRKVQLPEYIELAARLKQQVNGTIGPADGSQTYEQMLQRWHEAQDYMLPDLVDMALSLRAEQIAFMEHKFVENNKDYKDEFMSPDRNNRHKAHYKRTLDRAEYWYGRLDSGQRELLRQTVDAQPYNEELWLEERISRQHDLAMILKQIIAQKPTRDEVSQMLRGYFRRIETSPDPTRRDYIASMNTSNIDLAVKVANMAQPDQQERAVGKLDTWIEDMQSLE